MTKDILSNEELDALGNAIIEMFQLTKKRDGLFCTEWGRKTPRGVAASIVSLLRQHGINTHIVHHS